MASDIASMFKALLEAQEREMTWNPTSHHGFESSSTYQDELLNGNFPLVDQYGYGESCQSWNMAHQCEATYPSPTPNEEEIYNMFKLILEGQEKCNKMLRDQTWDMEPDHGEAHSSPISKEEENYNLLKLVLEGQEELNKSFREESEKLSKSLSMLSANIRDRNQDLKVAAPTHEENAEIKDEFLTQLNVDDNLGDVEFCTFLFDTSVENLDDGLDELDDTINNVEFCTFLFDTSVENLDDGLDELDDTINNVEFCTFLFDTSEDSWLFDSDVGVQGSIDELAEVDEDAPLLVSEDSDSQDGEDFSKRQEKTTIELSIDHLDRSSDADSALSATEPDIFMEMKPVFVPSPIAQPFDKHLDTLLPHAMSLHDPWKIPFEEIRMKEFRGWFYDEYDPGDRNPCYTPL